MNARGIRWQARWSRIISAIRILRVPHDEQVLLGELASGEGVRMLGFVNAHGMNSIVRDKDFFDTLACADILLRDGSGMAMLYRWSGRVGGMNMNGTDLIPKIIVAFRGRRVALWGTEEPYLSAAAAHCEAVFGARIISCENGFHDIDFYRRLSLEIKPELIVLGMGMPQQEQVARAIRSVADLPSLIVCGGAIIDFLGGKTPRAPPWMRGLGIEWIYRLGCEPTRLFDRYLIGNPLFLWRVQAWLSYGAEK